MAIMMSLTQRTAGILEQGGRFPHKYFQIKVNLKKWIKQIQPFFRFHIFISSMAYALKAYILKSKLIYVRESTAAEAVF